MKWYLDGKIMPPGWILKVDTFPYVVEESNGFMFISTRPEKWHIQTFKEDIPVWQIYRGCNSIHFVTNRGRK